MPDRREFLVGGLAVATLGTAEFLRPRRSVRLMPAGKLENLVPRNFGNWSEFVGGNVVAPTTPNSLADRLYSAVVTRIFAPTTQNAPPVMLLVAYGGEQSDLLQLHRPEACYPAIGMEIVEHHLASVPLAAGVSVPGVFLSASNGNGQEDIVYFTRLGESLPQTAAAQRNDRLREAMSGIIGDGVLVRASTYRYAEEPAWPYLTQFLSQMIRAMPPPTRRGLVGTKIAEALGSIPASHTA